MRNAIYLCLFAYENIRTVRTLDEMYVKKEEEGNYRRSIDKIFYKLLYFFFGFMCAFFYRKSTFFPHLIFIQREGVREKEKSTKKQKKFRCERNGLTIQLNIVINGTQVK